MRHARLLFPGLLLTGFLTSQCSLFDSKNSSDDDDDGGDGGQSGESTTGGASGSAGSGRAGRPSTGGTGSAGKGGSGTGGNDGGTTSVGGSATGGSATGGDGNTGALGGTNPGAGGNVSSGGTGGSVESGGTGGALGGSGGGGAVGGSSGGSGGSSAGTGGSGTGGSAGGLSCGVGQGLALPIEPGEDTQSAWIDGSSNCVGIQGALYPSVDEVGSSLTITENDGMICVAGTVKKVLSGDYDNYWGARLVIQLNNDGDATALPYDAVSHGVHGIKFTLSGTTVPEELRPTFFNSASATQYCKRVCATGAQSILISEAHVDCWEGTTGATPTGSSLERLEFLIPSNATADIPFDFCVEALTAITDDTTVGNPGICPESGDSCLNACGFSAANCYCDSLCLEDLTGCCADFEEMCLN